MPTPTKLLIDLEAEANIEHYEGFAPTTPGRPPTPREDDELSEKSDGSTIPAPPPRAETARATTSFRSTKYRTTGSTTSSANTSANTSANSSRTGSSLPSRTGSPAWKRATSAWGALTTERGQAERRLYFGRDFYGSSVDQYERGLQGPSMYDVRCSKTGSPLRGAKGTPSFSRTARRFSTAGDPAVPGQFGPGMYDIRCFKTGTPRGAAKRTPRFAPGERFDREKCYEGKENVRFGMAGASGLNAPLCSHRGSPLWKGGRPSAAFALPHIPRQRRAIA